MILDKYKNRYSYNIISLCGWLMLSLCIIINKAICVNMNTFAGIPLVGIFIFVGIIILGVFLYTTIFIIASSFYVIEERNLNLKRIKNEKFLNNKFVNIIQILGIIFFFLPTLGLLYLIISLFLSV